MDGSRLRRLSRPIAAMVEQALHMPELSLQHLKRLPTGQYAGGPQGRPGNSGQMAEKQLIPEPTDCDRKQQAVPICACREDAYCSNKNFVLQGRQPEIHRFSFATAWYFKKKLNLKPQRQPDCTTNTGFGEIRKNRFKIPVNGNKRPCRPNSITAHGRTPRPLSNPIVDARLSRRQKEKK